MRTERQNIVKVYTDASHDKFTSGMGFVIRANGYLIMEGMPVDEVTTSKDGELSAAAHGLFQAIRFSKEGSRVILMTDYLPLADFANNQPLKSVDDYADMLGPILDLATENNIEVEIQHIRGHGGGEENYETDDAWFNGIAHCLAGIARSGSEFSHFMEESPNIRQEVEDIHWRLNPFKEGQRRLSLNIEETAHELGIEKTFVEAMVTNGHVPFNSETLRIPIYAIRNIKKELEALRNGSAPSPV